MNDAINEDTKVVVTELKSIKEELEDHLSSINESSQEIETNYSYLMELDERVNRVEGKLDTMIDLLKKLTGDDNIKSDVKQIKLSEQEKELFMLFYTSDKALSYDELCEKVERSESYVRYYLNNLITKGIPIKKHSRKADKNAKSFFTLDSGFKELQAKSNILGISRTLTLDCFDQSILE